TLTLQGLTLQNNVATDSGSAIYNSGTLAVYTSTLTNNQATNNGALYNNGTIMVQSSTFANNSSRRGGGLYGESSGQVTIVNSTFGGNSATEGGGIHNRGVLTMTNSTLANNSGYGSGIHNWGGTLYLRNTLIAGTCMNQGTLATSVHNFVTNGSCGAAYSGTAYLSNLGNYGGPSTGSGQTLQTFALLPGSPALDRGDPAYCASTDQRGASRYGTCDIGAFESQGFQMSYGSGSGQSIDAGLTFTEPLTVTITANVSNEPVGPGGIVLLAGPGSGASISPASNASATSTGGASATLTANRVVGNYVVTATAYAVTTTRPITFALTNQPCVGAMVTNANDSGAGSLRQAISTVCPGGVITFDADYTINLSSTLAINREVAINGFGHKIIVTGDRNGDGSRDLQPFNIGASGIVTLTHLSVVSGTATLGSAIYNGGALVLDVVTVANNYAAANNSANLGTLYNVGLLTVKNSTFANNETFRGGGIYHRSGTAQVINSTFANNKVTDGGGIFNRGTLTVTNSTLGNNTASYGEDIYNSGTLTLLNSVLTGKSLSKPNCQGNTPILRLNNQSDDPSCGVNFYRFGLRVLPLGDYGGSSTGSEQAIQTMPLPAGSAAINAGNPTYCLATDQRGKPRLGTCDVGAVEWQGYHLVIGGGNNQSAGLNNSFPDPLQVTLVAAEGDASPPSGRTITFNAPSSGASVSDLNFTATTDSNNQASAAVTANSISGSYVVTATSSEVLTPVTFTLTNSCGLVTVRNANDSGAGSLRQALDEICDGGTITFDQDYAIYLDSTLAISKTVTINGTGQHIIVSGDSGNDGSPNVPVFEIAASGVVTITHLNVINGTAQDGAGAGIANQGVLMLQQSTIRDNTLTGDGSGAGLFNSGALTLTNSTVSNNSATDQSDGGGLTNFGAAWIINSTFSGNTAAANGGAIRNVGTLHLNNSTLSANSSASVGGGISNEGSLDLANTIIANSSSGGDCVNSGTLATNSHNLVADNSCSPALSGDPRLAALGDYGGDTQTFALLPDSPAIDAGDDTACATVDQRSTARVGVCDIGAFETQGFRLLLNGGDYQSANLGATFADPLQVSLVASDTNVSLSGQMITFTAPLTGASLDVSLFTAMTDAGAASASVTANSVVGSYVVTATTLGISDPVTFTLTNRNCDRQIVTNANDSGAGSLRQSIADACAGAVISFGGDYSIYLDSTLNIDKQLTIDGAGHNITVSGDSGNDGSRDVQPFKIEASGVVTITYMSIVNGTDASAGSSNNGGGILNYGALTLNHITMTDNVGKRFGGAINNGGTLTVNDSTIMNNDGGDYGGGILNYTTATINTSVIRGNRAGDQGGGLLNYDTLTLINSTVIGNQAGTGGGLYALGASTTISASTFSGNNADDGGGLYNAFVLDITNSTISGNTATSHGGGLDNEGGSVTLTNSTFSDNQAAAGNGGGVYNPSIYTPGAEGDP
ncbi:MAG: right-handed parallel beta-helix repeat-containing protein, partial [Chloroflexi bacterium]|nr:right-handed parallel beta-helix repeat-containing protein [Chloroflexota bacterium]